MSEINKKSEDVINKIKSDIKTNHKQDITGDKLQEVLLDMVDSTDLKFVETDTRLTDANRAIGTKISQVYTDGVTIKGTGTQSNPLRSILPSGMEDVLSYGVKFIGSSPDAIRTGNLDLHRSLPLQSQMKRCLVKDDGTVNYWLSQNNSLLKEDGTSSRLDGRDGQVMVYIPQIFYKVIIDGDNVEYRLSEYNIEGYESIGASFISAYQATLDRSNNLLSSVVNETANFRGGNNTSSWDDTYRSLLGKPVSVISLTNFEAYGRNRGNYWNCLEYASYKAMVFLFMVEYATRNSQKDFVSDVNSDGFRQGGLGVGATELDNAKWNTYNGYNPILNCGITNHLGNNTGVGSITMPPEYDDTNQKLNYNSYRGVEIPFGHLWVWCSGVIINMQSDAEGGKSIVSVYGKEVGNAPRVDGYVRHVIHNQITPREVGGGSTSNYCDYYYRGSIPTEGTTLRGFRFGGSSNVGSIAGLFCSSTGDSPTVAFATIGSRLCFLIR